MRKRSGDLSRPADSSPRSETIERLSEEMSRVPGVEAVFEREAERFEVQLKKTLESRREIFIFEAARLLSESLAPRPCAAPEEAPWTSVQSLSQLRALVGGRFPQLKARWIAAGFPLREHRGDREESAAINEGGWLELAQWILKQGFDARLPHEGEEGLFFLRAARR